MLILFNALISVYDTKKMFIYRDKKVENVINFLHLTYTKKFKLLVNKKKLIKLNEQVN